MKYIAFSLYGNLAMYCAGAIKNVHLAKHWYPDYKCIFFVDKSVPEGVVSNLLSAGSIVRNVGESTGIGGMFWRFWINDEPDMERYLIRDADSRIGERDVAAVRAWEESGKGFHVCRDHPHHTTEILGGLWGARGGAVPNMAALINNWTGPKEGYDADQEFLRKVIWPLVRPVALQHDSCTRHLYPDAIPHPIPFSYKNPRFACEVFDAKDNPRLYDWDKIFLHVELQKAKNPPLFILPHLGLGDLLICSAMIRLKSLEHDSITIPVKIPNLGTASDLFRDSPSIKIFPIHENFEAINACDGFDGDRLRLGVFSDGWNNQKEWDRLLYDQAEVPFEHRWGKFFVSEIQSESISTPDSPFALLHEDALRGFVIPHRRRPKLPTVSVFRTKSLMQWIWMIQNADEIHCIDSSVAILADSIPTNARKLVLHLYARKGAKPPSYAKNWTILEK